MRPITYNPRWGYLHSDLPSPPWGTGLIPLWGLAQWSQSFRLRWPGGKYEACWRILD